MNTLYSNTTILNIFLNLCLSDDMFYTYFFFVLWHILWQNKKISRQQSSAYVKNTATSNINFIH